MKQLPLNEISDYIRANLHLNPTPAEIAGHFGISRFALSRRFRAETGLSLREYLAALKIEQSIANLVAGGSIINAQLDAGHASAGTFSRLFRYHTGLSPRDYRNRSGEFARALEGELADRNRRAIAYRRFEPPACRLAHPITLNISGQSPHGVVFVGLFAEPVPRNTPVQGWAVFSGGRVVITEMPAGEYYLLACEIVPSTNPLDYFHLDHCLRAKFAEPLVFPPERALTHRITLRPLQAGDPPITLNLPKLLFDVVGGSW